MAIRKKTTAESETVRAEESAKSGQKTSRTRTTAAANEATGASEKKSASAKSPAAATHKSSARKVVKAAPAAEPVVVTVAAGNVAFEVGLHHEEICKEAYLNWLRNGCPQGTEHHDWITAIEIVRERYEK